MKAIQQLARHIIRRRHRQCQQRKLGCEDATAKAVFDHLLQEHCGEDPENTSARVCYGKHDDGEDEVGRAAERYVEDAAYEKRDSDGLLHVRASFAAKSSGGKWADGCTYA